MRKLLAAFLLLCLGMMIPSGAASVRLCLLNGQISPALGDVPCCDECSCEDDESDPCCIDFEQLPDASAPLPPLEIPPALWTGIPPLLMGLATSARDGSIKPCVVSEPIRGPSSPAAHRAVLSIWRV